MAARRPTTTSAAQRDPFAFELFRNAVSSIADEMALTIYRTAYSSVLKGGMDYSTAVCDAQGRMIAQGLTQPSHLGSIPAALASVMRHYDTEISPGDVYAMNDPFDGGMHLPDIFLFKPIYHGGQRVAFAATVAHHTDVGGRVAGSNAADSTECYQEGLRIPPLKLFEAGKRNDTLWKLIEKNVRVPSMVQGDMRAQLAACHTAEKGMLELVERYGSAAATRYLAEILDHTERLTRVAIRDLPNGTFEFEDWLDDDGVDLGQPIRLKVTVRKTGSRIVADWTGTSPQVRGALNCTLSFTRAVVHTAIKTILPGNIPANEGFSRAVEVIAPPGTISNCVLPASTAARGLTGYRQLDCCFGALAKMVPDRVFAASDGGNVGVSVGGFRADRSPFIYVDFHCGAWGGRPWADGLQGNANVFANISSPSAEMIDAETPVTVLAYEFIQDSMGAGKFRGGSSFRRDYRMKEEHGTLQIRNDRRRFRPFGLHGGKPGKPSRNVLNPGRPDEVLLDSKITREIRKGDVVRYEMAGAGGWGDPLERDPERVLRDARNEYISLAAARDDYGVVVDAKAWTVDLAATTALRAAKRKQRGRAALPFVDRGGVPDGIRPAD
jgi:N-methylhydantoinase B